MSRYYKIALPLLALFLFSWIAFSGTLVAFAQSETQRYKYVQETIYVKEPVKVSKWVEETVYEKETKKSFKHIWNTEQRERRTTVKKPVTKTSYQEERTIVRKPITETKYREKRLEETSYETVTETREEQYTVQKPVYETEMRDETVTVRKKVTEDLIEVQNVTAYKPVQVQETSLVQSDVPVTQLYATPDTTQRPRLQWIDPGYYTDPATGQSVYRRRGLHWVQPSVAVAVADTVPTFVPQTTQRTTYVPQTIERRRPVEVSRYEDRVETRRVPVEVKKMVNETVTRRVPYTVQKPITKIVVEKVPYQETRYVDEVIVNRIPVEETTYEEVTEVEPYEIEVSRWVPVTEEVEVPKTVRKRVEYEEIREVPKTIRLKIPVDENGNAIGPGVRVDEAEETTSSQYSTGYGTTEGNSVGSYQGTWGSSPSEARETSLRPNSVMVPETSEPTAADPRGELSPLQRDTDAETTAKSKTELETTRVAPAASKPQLPKTGNPAGNDSQNISDIANLEVRKKPEVSESSGLPSAARPDSQPTDSGDEFAAERK